MNAHEVAQDLRRRRHDPMIMPDDWFNLVSWAADQLDVAHREIVMLTDQLKDEVTARERLVANYRALRRVRDTLVPEGYSVVELKDDIVVYRCIHCLEKVVAVDKHNDRCRSRPR